MANIQGATSLALLEVGATSKAAFAKLYDGRGRPLTPNYNALWQAQVIVRQSAATGAGAIVWGIYNASSTKIVVVTRAQLQLFFDGTAVATLMKYELAKYTGVTSFTGGALVTSLLKQTSLGQPAATIRVLDTGLTQATGTAQTPWLIGSMGRVTQTTTNFQSVLVNLDFAFGLQGGIELAQNELLAIRQNVVSVIGDNINGWVEGYEFTPAASEP